MPKKKINPELSEAMRQLAFWRHKNTPKWKRKLHSRKMAEAKRLKKLSTEAELKRLRKEVEGV